MLLSVLLGNGAQIVIMAATTLLFAAFGFLSPSNRGALVTTILVVYVCVAFIAGFVSSRFYKMFGGESWKTNVLLTAFLVPGYVLIHNNY
jgi:transmembrane 9 superfamily protein 2/4